MQFADASKIEFRDPGTRHREGNIAFKYLLKGESRSPQNYELSLVRTEGRFYGPPHRHNFDQFRYVMSGKFGEPRKLELDTGEAGYYPEGTPYKIDSGDSEVLLLQFGGASGHGFTHYDELRATYPELAKLGTFTDGIFRWTQPPPGTAKQQDGYEALWEYIHKKPLVYPKMRFRQPVLMKPTSFNWVATGEKGVWTKFLGSFNERNFGVGQLKIDAGCSAKLDSPGTVRLLYVLEGSGNIGEQAVTQGCAVEIERGKSYVARANEEMVMMELLLPRFEGNA